MLGLAAVVAVHELAGVVVIGNGVRAGRAHRLIPLPEQGRQYAGHREPPGPGRVAHRNRREAFGMTSVGPLRHTFVFADLAGFTALTEVHGDDRAADVAVEFCRSVNRLLPPGAEDLKMLGDACLLRVDAAADAVALGLTLTGEVAARHGVPDVRVGMNTGTVVRRGAEWFGAAINIAARVAAMPGPGEVLLTRATREAVGDPPGLRFVDRGVHELRHVTAPVQLYRAHYTVSGNG